MQMQSAALFCQGELLISCCKVMRLVAVDPLNAVAELTTRQLAAAACTKLSAGH
jgi:hypothetical protein